MTIFYPAEGRNHILDVTLRGATQVPEWRVAMFEGDYTPQEDDTAANIVARATEITAYSESTRPIFTESAASSGASDNIGALAQFIGFDNLIVGKAKGAQAQAKPNEAHDGFAARQRRACEPFGR